MIIFQTAGGGDAGSLGFGAVFSDTGASTTTFRNNSYIHRLNRTLQAEMRAVSAHATAVRKLEIGAISVIESSSAIHQSAGRELINLIIANRGVPENKTALSIGLTKTIINACQVIPDPVATKVTMSTLRGIERHVVSSYKKLQKVTPRKDQPIIDELMKAALSACSMVATYRP